QFQQGIIVGYHSESFGFGYVDCSAKLNRCANFGTISIANFKKLDVAQDNSAFAQLINKNDGSVTGRSCMSQADVDKIQLKKSDKCLETDKSCYCTSDQCTGASGVSMTLLSLVTVLIYSI
ncbi:hypothetical protein PENTCL1PPCAC_5204, partial [Pristionchus entomophagus]